MDAGRLERIAKRQFGLFTRAQARACGYSQYQIRRRLGTGEWQRICGPVLAFRGLRPNVMTFDRAAQLSVRGAVLAGPSAARVWDIPVPDSRTYLLVAAKGGSRLAGIRLLHETVDPRDVGRCDGMLVTSRSRTIVDCLRILPEQAAAELLDRALQRGWIGVDDLAERVVATSPRRGMRQVRRLVRRAHPGTRSVAERRLAGLLRRAGISGWCANVPISDGSGLIGVGDIVFDGARLVVELDGWAFHTTPDRFQRDRSRQNRLVAAGWTVLRFTWHDLVDRPGYVTATIRTMLARLSA